METLSAVKTQSWLSWFLRGILILGFLAIAARLIELQVIKGGYFRGLAEGNRIRRIPIVAPRGEILARGGEVLVGNKEIRRAIVFTNDEGFLKSDDLSGARGEDIITEYERDYPFKGIFAHVSGYLGEVNESEIGKINPLCPEKGPRKGGSLIGRSGLEEEYECTLGGINGEELIEVNNRGQKVRILGEKPATPGTNIKTSIDANLQIVVAEVMKETKGAAVITDKEGAVFALYSAPSFDPNSFVGEIDSQAVSSYLKSADLPLFNRVIGGEYHPGSVFKPLVAIAALSEGKVSKDFLFEDTGVISVNGFNYTNWYFNQYGRTEGKINIVRAIARSTDTFFYKMGEFLGINAFADWAKKFGMGKPTGIDLPGETTGLMPDPEWKKRVKNENWFLGNTYHASIGQGDVTTTVAQINSLTRVIANGGKLCTPRIADTPECKDLGIKADVLKTVKEGMIEACSTGGTGYTFFDFEPQVACKTGTAETNLDGKTHAWFTVFGPADFPEIVATVLVEGGGEGSKVAGPLAREIFNYYFGKVN